MQFEYQLKRQVEKFGPFQLEVECLENINQTIDQVFAYLEELGRPEALEELCPYFGIVWPAALGLTQYLVAQPKSSLEGQSILELGCGLAIPSMIVSKLGAQVTATDSHVDVPRFLEKNLKLNGISHLDYRQVNWESESSGLGQYDWVIGSDILYERRYPESLAQTISRRVSPHGQIVIADPGRPYLQSFADCMKSLGFSCTTQIETVVSTSDEGKKGPQDVFVLVMKRV